MGIFTFAGCEALPNGRTLALQGGELHPFGNMGYIPQCLRIQALMWVKFPKAPFLRIIDKTLNQL
jgi:hypothetical protein